MCIPGLVSTCLGDVVTSAAGGFVSGLLGNSFANAMRDGAAWVISTTVGWWIDVPAIDLDASPAHTIREYVLWLAVVVATAGVIWQGILMAISRRSEPLLDVGRGLFVLCLWSAVGIIGPATALQAGDAFASWALDRAAHGNAADRLVELASMQGIDSAGAAILLGLLMMIAGLVQAVLMMFREGASVILSGVVVLAAAGSMTRGTRPWLPKVVGWMLALICYKPAAALVYASALELVGTRNDPRTFLIGLTMMLLAIVALPVLMRLFNWASGTATGGGGGMSSAVAASAAAIHAGAMMRGGSQGSAADEAQCLRSDLGPVNGTAPTGATTTPPASPVPAQASSAGTGASAATGGTTTSAAASGAGGAAAAAGGPAGVVVLAAQAGVQLVNQAKSRVDDAINSDGGTP